MQKKIIGERNFTYLNLLPLINKYLCGRENVLDIGCGVGTIDFFIASKGKKITGIDISYNAIEQCLINAKLLNLSAYTNFLCGDFLNLGIGEKYDMVICLEVLEHLKEDDLAIKKIYKLLTRDGVLMLSVPSKNSPLFKLGFIKKFDKKVGHLRRYSSQEIIEILKKNNFLIVEEKSAEGFLRNILFTGRRFDLLVKMIRGIVAEIFTVVDNILAKIFGESDIIIVARKK